MASCSWEAVDVAAPGSPDAARTDALVAAAAGRLSELVSTVRSAWISIDRMSCPALLDQLAAAATQRVDTVVCSVLDADPAMPIHSAIAESHAAQMHLGVKWLQAATGASTALIVHDREDRHIRRGGANVRYIAIDHVYPQSHPTLLLRRLLDRVLKPHGNPVDASVVCVDAAAAWTLARILLQPESPAVPLIVRDRRDARAARSAYVLASPAATLGQLLGQLAIRIDLASTIRVGPIQRDHRADATTTLGSLGCTIDISHSVMPAAAEPCIRSGWCIDVCPVGVRPALALELIQTKRARLVKSAHADRCIDCGLCQFVCPSRLPLLEAVRAAAAV